MPSRAHLCLYALCVVIALTGCGSSERSQEPPATQTATLTPRTVTPDHLRRRDIAGESYSPAFRESFTYEGQFSVTWQTEADTLRGTLVVTGAKPNFAYQMKLVGRTPITTAQAPKASPGDPEAWACWQLGHVGRWWCEQDGWNVADGELADHLRLGHTVHGYLLFDFLLTDAEGNARQSFALDSSFHVLWRDDQRERTGADSQVRGGQIVRGSWGYGLSGEPVSVGQVGLFAEGEPNRPAPGEARLPAGEYSVWLNITEESFHDNLGTEVFGGGFWAQVLETNLRFTVVPGGAVGRWPFA